MQAPVLSGLLRLVALNSTQPAGTQDDGKREKYRQGCPGEAVQRRFSTAGAREG